MTDITEPAATLHRIASRSAPPPPEEIAAEFDATRSVLESEPSERRPRDTRGRPGGIVSVRSDLPTVVVPDVHARIDLIISVLSSRFPEHGIDEMLLNALAEERAQLVFVGDYVHGEARARERWVNAFREFTSGYKRHTAIDNEMRESLGALGAFAVLKRTFPATVHGLKGNHENIANEEGGGNHPFGKFVYEGAMVAEYMARFYAGDAYESVYRLEKALPLVVVGGSFIVTHAEPARFFPVDEVIEYHDRPDVVEGLTWTDNDAAEPGSVEATIAHYLPHCDPNGAIHLGGHRPVAGRYALRAGGRYVQFHNPSRMLVALPPANRAFDPERDVVEIEPSEAIFDGKDR